MIRESDKAQRNVQRKVGQKQIQDSKQDAKGNTDKERNMHRLIDNKDKERARMLVRNDRQKVKDIHK